MNLYEWLKATAHTEVINGSYTYQHVRPKLVCKDGTTMSVQASANHYSTPRADMAEEYTEVEMWCLSGNTTDALLEYGDGNDPWAYVPIGVIIDLINEHGGIDAVASMAELHTSTRRAG